MPTKKSVAPKKKRARRRVEPVFDWPEPHVRVVQVARETEQDRGRREANIARSADRSAHLYGRAGAAAQARLVAVPDAFELAVIGVHIHALCRAFGKLGQNDAAFALIQLEEAIEDGDPYLPARLCAAADPRTVKGRAPTRAALAFRSLVPSVQVVREEINSENGNVLPPLSEERTVAFVVRDWVDALGVPTRAATSRPDDFVAGVLSDKGRVAKMADVLRKGDAAAFVRFVHRELGYPGTNNLGNASIQRRSRAHRAKKRSTSKR